MATVAAACLLTVCLAFAAIAQAPSPTATDPTLKADPEVVKCIAKGHEALNKMQIEPALKEFQGCVQKFPESALARYWLGVAYFSSRDKEKAINELIEESPRTLSLNMAELKYIDSSGIGSLIKAMNITKNRDIDLVITDLDKEILHIFKLAYLDRFFTISTQEEIIEKYS